MILHHPLQHLKYQHFQRQIEIHRYHQQNYNKHHYTALCERRINALKIKHRQSTNNNDEISLQPNYCNINIKDTYDLSTVKNINIMNTINMKYLNNNSEYFNNSIDYNFSKVNSKPNMTNISQFIMEFKKKMLLLWQKNKHTVKVIKFILRIIGVRPKQTEI